jgi:hypothetical protein
MRPALQIVTDQLSMPEQKSAAARRRAAAEWSGKMFWENTAGRVILQLLRERGTVSRGEVIEALKDQLQDPDQDYRAAAIREAIARIEKF